MAVSHLVHILNQPVLFSLVDTVQMLVDELGYEEPVLHAPIVHSFAYTQHGENIYALNKIKAPERKKINDERVIIW